MFGELQLVLRYISQQIETHQLIKLHVELAQFYEQARSAPSEEVTQNITSTKDKIRQAQDLIQPKDWDVIRIKMFESFGATAVLGRSGYSRLEQELSITTNDPSGAAQNLEKMAAEIESLKQRSEQAVNSLEPLFGKEEKVSVKGKEKIQLVFDGMVSIERMDDMRYQADEWNLILKNLKHLSPEPQEDAILSNIYKASPTVVIIIASIPIILALAKLTKYALEIVEKLYAIRKLQLEVRSVDLNTERKERVLKDLEEAELDDLTKLVEEKVEKFMSTYKPKLDADRANPVSNSARYITKKIYNFTVLGGNVNLVDGKIKNGDEIIQQSQFREVYEKIKGSFERKEQTLLLASLTPEEQKTAKKVAVYEAKTSKKVNKPTKRISKKKLPK